MWPRRGHRICQPEGCWATHPTSRWRNPGKDSRCAMNSPHPRQGTAKTTKKTKTKTKKSNQVVIRCRSQQKIRPHKKIKQISKHKYPIDRKRGPRGKGLLSEIDVRMHHRCAAVNSVVKENPRAHCDPPTPPRRWATYRRHSRPCHDVRCRHNHVTLHLFSPTPCRQHLALVV